MPGHEVGLTGLECTCDLVTDTGELFRGDLRVGFLGIRGDLLRGLLAESLAPVVY